MKNGRNLALGLLLLVSLALGFSACGGSGGDSTSSDESGISADRGEISGTVKVWDTEYGSLPTYTKAVDRIDAEFEATHPDVTVRREAQPLANLEALLRATFTAKEGPDAVLFSPGAAGVLSYTTGLEVLNDQLDPALQDELTQWGSATPGFTEEGDHYGIPIGVIGKIFWYNKVLFEKAGLSREFKPQSWDEVIETAEKLEAAGIQPFVGGNKEGYENQWWFGMGAETEATDEQITELAEGTLDWTGKGVTNSFRPLFEVAEADLYDANDRFSKGFVEGCADFSAGRGAMIIGFWNAICDANEFSAALGEDSIGFFFAPGTSAVGQTAGLVMSVPTYAENKDGVLALLEYQASKKGMEVMVDVGGLMPNRDDVELPTDAPIQARELLKAAREMDSQTSPESMVPAAIAFGPMTSEVSTALQGNSTLEAAQEAMQETAEKSVGR